MRIGMTYDLRQDYLAQGYGDEETAEFDSPRTIEAIEAGLRRTGAEVDRIGNIHTLAARLVDGERWDLVFNIAEGLGGRAREAQVPALLEAYGVPYTFSDPVTLGVALDKALAKRVVRDHGVPTAPFALVACPEDIAAIDLPLPLFAKPNAEGTGKGIAETSRIARRDDLAATIGALLERYRQPVIVETFLPGREFTVGLLGTGADARALGVLEITVHTGSANGIYSYLNKENWRTRVALTLVDDAEARAAADVALAAWRALGCRDAGRVDLRSDANGRPHFLEVNPLAGLHPTHSDLPILCQQIGMEHAALIAAIVESASERRAGAARRRLAAVA